MRHYYTDLHANDSIDEEDESDEDGDPWQRLEGLDEGPEEGADALALAEQLDETHDAEEAEKVDGNHVPAGLQSETVRVSVSEVRMGLLYNYDRRKVGCLRSIYELCVVGNARFL